MPPTPHGRSAPWSASADARLYHRPQGTSAWQDSNTTPDSRRFSTAPSTAEQQDAMMNASRYAETMQALSGRTRASSDGNITELDRDMNDCGAQIMPYCSDFSVGVMNVSVTKNVRCNVDDETISVLVLLLAIRLLKAGWVGLSFLFTSLPRSVRLSNANSLIITDALGFTITLHYSQVQTYDDLATCLIGHFKGRVGEQRVKKRRYCIAQAGSGRIVGKENWGMVFKEREELVMSMLIEQEYNEALRQACPKCGKTEIGIDTNKVWFICRRCHAQFLPLEEGTTKPSYIPPKKNDDDGNFRNVRRVEVKILSSFEAAHHFNIAAELEELRAEARHLRSSSSDPPKDRHPASAYGTRAASPNGPIPRFESPRFQEPNE